MITYEQQLDQDPRWALMEGSLHFERKSKVFETLERITARLDDLDISYALIGDLAMFMHGFRRFTEVVELLVTANDLKRIQEKLNGLGFRQLRDASKRLRDTESGVRIEFVTAGEFPGDGKQGPIAFPDPVQPSTRVDGYSVLTLQRMVELKLASGMICKGRLRDLADAQELIRALGLSVEFGDQLDQFVQETYRQLWSDLQE